MSTQIQVIVLIKRGTSPDDIIYLNDKEAMFNLGIEKDPDIPGIRLQIGDIIKIEGEKRKIDDICIQFLNDTLREYTAPKTGYQLNSTDGLQHPYNCEIIYKTSVVV